MAATPAAALTAGATDVFSGEARATIDRACDRFVRHLAAPVLLHEHALRDGGFPFPTEAQESPEWDPRAIGRHPVLAQAIDCVTAEWRRAHDRLAERFAGDFPGLRIEAIAPFRSDPHDGQQTVAILSLSDGRLVVYKPRPLAMESAFGELLEWVSAHGFPWRFRRPEVDSRQEYGWMEHVAAAPCRSEAEVYAFYARAGGLLCLLALLQATDIHHENVIAAGDQPVIVDLETIGQPRPAPVSFAQALAETGLLPNGDALDFSALGATGAFDTPFGHRVPLRENVAMLGKEPQPAVVHAAAVMSGFAAMFRLLVAYDARERLLRFDGCRVREIRRASNDYGLLLQESRQPHYMRDASERRRLFTRLRDVTPEELAALERFDVPRFTTRCDATPLLAAYERLSESQLPALLTTIAAALERRRDHGR